MPMKKLLLFLAAAAVAAPSALCQSLINSNFLDYSIESLSSSSAKIAVENPFESKPAIHYAVDKGRDIFSTSKLGSPYFYFANSGWIQVADPKFTITGDKSFDLDIVEGNGPYQWQGQVNIPTTLQLSASKYYDIVFDVESDEWISSILVKASANDDDSKFIVGATETEPALNYGEKKTRFMAANCPGLDIDNAKLTFDFTQTTTGQKITVSNIRLIEHDNVMFEGDEIVSQNILAGVEPKIEVVIQDENYQHIPDAASIEYADGTATITALKDGNNISYLNNIYFTFPDIKTDPNAKYYLRYTVTASEDIDLDYFTKLTANEPKEIAEGPIRWNEHSFRVQMSKFPKGLVLKISSIEAKEITPIYKNTQATGDDFKISLDGLTPHTDYICRFQALNDNNGVYSAPEYVLFRTEDPAGVEDVAADAENADAEWYTIQGIRVAAPVPGNIYIRVCGGKPTKVLF